MPAEALAARCELTELYATQCGCPEHRDLPDPVPAAPTRAEREALHG